MLCAIFKVGIPHRRCSPQMNSSRLNRAGSKFLPSVKSTRQVTYMRRGSLLLDYGKALIGFYPCAASKRVML